MRLKQLQRVLPCLTALPHCRQEAVLLHCLQGQPNGDEVSAHTEQGAWLFVADCSSLQSSAQSLWLLSDHTHG